MNDIVERSRREQRERLIKIWDADPNPVFQEARKLAERAGFDWYDTESCARMMAMTAAREILALRAADRDGESHV